MGIFARVLPLQCASGILPETMARFSVLHLLSGSVPGGVLKYVIDLAVATRDHGIEVVLAGRRGAWHSMVEQHGLAWVEVPIGGNVLSLARTVRVLADATRDNPPAIIHAHYRKAALVGRWLGRTLARRHGADGRPTLLFTLHLTDVPMSFPFRILSDFGDVAHAPSQQARQWLIKVARVPEDRIVLIPHGIDPARFPLRSSADRLNARRQFGVAGDAVLVAYVGRLEDPKNEMWALDLPQTMPSLHLVMAGDGPNRPTLQRTIADRGIAGRVRILGDCDPLPVYHAADLLVLPSAREGFSYVCAEAMSCGVPVLRTRTAGCEEMIVEGVTGRSCAVERGTFVQTALEMLAHPELLPAMGRSAAGHIRANLTFQRQIERTVELYHELAKNR